MIRNYAELTQIATFEGRYEYLRLGGRVGADTFGHDRVLNQAFYTSSAWRQLRNEIIVRDQGCDLAVDGREISSKILIHHMNPLTVTDVVHGTDNLMDPAFLITVSHNTHNAIHYGDYSMLDDGYIERLPGDTTLWG